MSKSPFPDKSIIPDDWEEFQQGACSVCGGDIYADPGLEGGGFPDGADAACNDCGKRGSISCDGEGDAWYSEHEDEPPTTDETETK